VTGEPDQHETAAGASDAPEHKSGRIFGRSAHRGERLQNAHCGGQAQQVRRLQQRGGVCRTRERRPHQLRHPPLDLCRLRTGTRTHC